MIGAIRGAGEASRCFCGFDRGAVDGVGGVRQACRDFLEQNRKLVRNRLVGETGQHRLRALLVDYE